MDDMQFSINDKEAEIIRLNMCLGDERKRNCDTSLSNKNNENTPSRHIK